MSTGVTEQRSTVVGDEESFVELEGVALNGKGGTRPAQRAPAPPPLSDQELAEAARRLEGRHPREIIAWALDRFPAERVVVLTSLQAGGMAAADMAQRLDERVRIVTIDTGRLPEETHAYLDTVRSHLGRRIEVIYPDAAAVGRFTSEHGPNSFYASVEQRLSCCHVRKVEPLGRLLTDVDCWMTGLRADRSDARPAKMIERDDEHGGIVKLNPVATWSESDARDYLKSRAFPLHPLYARGYRSIGCAPCTRAVDPGEHPRSGRWWWELGVEKECGIHRRPESNGNHAQQRLGEEATRV
jgi:phosphoadenylyl-sulfate reductase (thioredoxin)